MNFIKNIQEGEKVILIYDADVDGLCSAALLLSVLEKLEKKVDNTPTGFAHIEKLKTKLEKFEKIIAVDVPIDLIEKHLVSMGKDMLIIDHHPGKDLNSEKVILINPRLEKPKIYQPTSYVVYKMFSGLIEEKKWVAIVGTIGDLGIDDCKDLVKIEDKKNIWKNKFGNAAVFLNSSISILGPEKTLKILMKSKNLEEFRKNEKIVSASKKFEIEVKKCEREFKRNLEVHDKILISEIDSKYRGICSTLATKLAMENPENVIFIFERIGKNIKIHGRSGNKKINVGELFKKLGIGGGHEAAGAGKIKVGSKEEIKIMILEKLKTIYS